MLGYLLLVINVSLVILNTAVSSVLICLMALVKILLPFPAGKRAATRAANKFMWGWATVNAGHYDHFAGESDLDQAFDRAFCLLRRPVRYTIEAQSRYETPPLPGLLAVELEEGVFASNAIELILDASGSMLQRIGDKRRIEIARDVLTELVGETLPEGVPLAFRVFEFTIRSITSISPRPTGA